MSDFLEVNWARTHNLKNISVKIPKNKITVITWLSWSWKSSLAFNTIYSIWQQKYLESLSSYARMFIWWMKEEAEVDEIKWLSPTISIDQKTTNNNPRSTVWTITEIYDYFKLLFLNIWIRKCVKCDTLVKKDSLQSLINYISSFSLWEKFIIKTDINQEFNSFSDIKKEVLSLWFIRFEVENNIFTINEESEFNNKYLNKKIFFKKISIVLDRLKVSNYSDIDSSDLKRLKDSLELAYKIWKWQLIIDFIWKEEKKFSNIFVCSNCGHVPKKLTISSFSFNSHNWACKDCHWLGIKKIFLEEKIINYNLTLSEGAIIAPWFWWNYFLSLLDIVWKENKINTNIKYNLLSEREKKIILYWTWEKIYNVNYINEYNISSSYNTKFEWIINTLTRRYYDGNNDKWHYDEYIIDIDCQTCLWYRLDKESLNVYINNINIWELSNLSVVNWLNFLQKLDLSKNERIIIKNVLKNAIERMEFLIWVWLNYMTFSRKAWTLSWWEAQRIRLATQIWTKLEWIIYVLDEPSIWLHPRDNYMLINNIKKLRDIWNTLIIVEHDEDIMNEADYILDIWPWAWVHWGYVIAEWNLSDLKNNKKSITWLYLNNRKLLINKKNNRKKDKFLEIHNANQNNLKNINVILPLSNFIVVTGVSWSWKSSLVNDVLANYLLNKLNRAKRKVWDFWNITWLWYLDKAVVIDQSPIWKTPRSNPATYTWVFTFIRELFSETSEAKIRGYWPWRFSFNTKTWRCNSCDWDGVKKIEMHFLPPIYINCEECKWTRYNNETLQIKYKWKNISDILKMTIEEWIDFFVNHPKIMKILTIINDVWLWYITFWQSSVTLSWWEAQRIKLSTELSKKSTTKTFYILDEPTTWLHFQDVDKLLKILHSLVDKWNTVLVIEHNMSVIINADYIIDIWKEWWDKWWELIASWSIEDIRKCKNSYTWEAINKYLDK